MHRQTGAATQPDGAFRFRSSCAPRKIGQFTKIRCRKPRPIVPQHPVMPHPLLKLGPQNGIHAIQNYHARGIPVVFLQHALLLRNERQVLRPLRPKPLAQKRATRMSAQLLKRSSDKKSIGRLLTRSKIRSQTASAKAGANLKP